MNCARVSHVMHVFSFLHAETARPLGSGSEWQWGTFLLHFLVLFVICHCVFCWPRCPYERLDARSRRAVCLSNVGENEIEHVPRHEEAKQLGKSNPPPPSAGSSIVLVVE